MSSMTDNETYNGYANRETWAFNLHWQNDQGLYNETLEEARRFVREELSAEEHTKISDFAVGERVVEFWRNLIDNYREDFGENIPTAYRAFDREVGSWWRIDYREVGEAVRESLDAEA